MSYRKPTNEEIEIGMYWGWSKEQAERGYEIFDYDGTGLLIIEGIYDVFSGDCDDEECAREAERSGYCKIIPLNELPKNFMIDGYNASEWFGWVDTPENRKAIEEYCKEVEKH